MLRVMKVGLRSNGHKGIATKAIPNCYEIKLLYNIYSAYMKIVFTISFLIFCLSVYSHTVIVGTGSGAVIQEDMQGLKPGDTLAIRSGMYEIGGSFSRLEGITII